MRASAKFIPFLLACALLCPGARGQAAAAESAAIVDEAESGKPAPRLEDGAEKALGEAAGGGGNKGSAENQENGEEPVSVIKPEAAEDQEGGAVEQAAFPGVRNASIIHKEAGKASLEIYYPVFNNKAVDESVKAFAERQAEDFKKEISAADGESAPEGRERWDLSGSFSLERPGPDVVSVIFNIYSYTGGAHPNLEIFCLNYDLKSGKALDFADLFKDPEKALEIMSGFSAKHLTNELGDYADEDMIQSGTAPDLPNFSNLSLLPDGLYIEFQPYQVGPWAAGPQRIKMTLADLAAAGPEEGVWPKAAGLPPAPAEPPEIAPAAGQTE